MIYIVINILLSSAFILGTRWAQHRQTDILSVGAVNYIVSFVCALLVFQLDETKAVSIAACASGATTGAAYFVAFFFLATTLQWKGAALASVVSRLSILVPILCGILIWHEQPSTMQYAGIALACVALGLIRRGRLHLDMSQLPWYAPLHVALFFVVAGVSRLGTEAFHQTAASYEKPSFLLAAFGLSAFASVLLMLIRRRLPGRQELLFGAGIGLTNISQTFVILKALDVYDGFIVFSMVSAGGVVFTTLVAVFLMGEKLTRASCIGIAIATIALVMLQANS